MVCRSLFAPQSLASFDSSLWRAPVQRRAPSSAHCTPAARSHGAFCCCRRNYGATAGPIVSPLAALRAALPAANVSFNPATAYAYSESNAQADAQACEVNACSRLFVKLGISACQEQQACDPGAYSFGPPGPYVGNAAYLQARDALHGPLGY